MILALAVFKHLINSVTVLVTKTTILRISLLSILKFILFSFSMVSYIYILIVVYGTNSFRLESEFDVVNTYTIYLLGIMPFFMVLTFFFKNKVFSLLSFFFSGPSPLVALKFVILNRNSMDSIHVFKSIFIYRNWSSQELFDFLYIEKQKTNLNLSLQNMIDLSHSAKTKREALEMAVAISDENNAIALALANARAVADRDAMAIVAEAGSSNTATYIVAGLAIATVVFVGWVAYSYYFGGPKGGGTPTDALFTRVDHLESGLSGLITKSDDLILKVDSVANVTFQVHSSHVADKKTIGELFTLTSDITDDLSGKVTSIVENTSTGIRSLEEQVVELATTSGKLTKQVESLVSSINAHSVEISKINKELVDTSKFVTGMGQFIKSVSESIPNLIRSGNLTAGRVEVMLERLTGTSSSRLVRVCKKSGDSIDAVRMGVPPFISSTVPTGSTVPSTSVVPTTGATSSTGSSSVTSIVSSILDLE